MDFYRIFKARYPETGVLYISDAGAVPYGKQSKAELLERLGRVAAFLGLQGVSRLVVACNAMSTVLPGAVGLPALKDIGITGVIEPTLSAVLALKGKRVGVAGGRRTILSGAYGKPLRQRFPSVSQRVAQPLSALIERGEKDTPLFSDTLRKIMTPLKNSDILVLACTHYPAALNSFRALAPKARLVNPSEETFKWVEQNWRFDDPPAPDAFFTTGDPEEMRRASHIAFGVNPGEITRITL
jgi:glutamate racemase